MDTEFDPFIAGLPFGAVIGVGPLLTPRLCGGLLVLLLLWIVFVILSAGLPGFETVALKLVQQMVLHARMVLGLCVGAVLGFSIVRSLIKKECGL